MLALKALVAQAAASATVMLLSILIARSGGTAALGELGVAMALFLLAQSAAREASIMTLVSLRPSGDQIRQRCRRQSLIGLIASVLMISAAVVTRSWTVLIIGAGAHGMLLAHYARLVSLTLGRGRLAMVQELLILGCVLVPAAGSFLLSLPGHHALTTWVVSYAVIGYVTALAMRMDIRPSWDGGGREGKVGGVFAAQSLMTAGSVHVVTLALATMAGSILVGALRGAATVIAPANTILTALHPLAVARLGPLRHGTRRQLLVRLAALAGGAVGMFILVAGAMIVVVHFHGEVLLGDAWVDVQPILWIVALDGLIGAACFVPSAAHRALWEPRRSSVIAVMAAVLRFPLVLGGALSAGAAGAAAGFTVATALLCVAWWVSATKLEVGVRK